MRTLRNLTLAVVAVAVWAPPVLSQETDRMIAEEGAIHLLLLRQKSVREELKLTPEEAAKIKEFNARQWQKAQAIHKLPRDSRHSRFEELSRENEQFLSQTIAPAKRKRLDEISLQVAGLLLITDPKIAAQIGLTEQQKEQLERHRREARHEMSEALHGRSKERREEKLKELSVASRKRLYDVLTDQQEATWKQMTGAPFVGAFVYDPDDEG